VSRWSRPLQALSLLALAIVVEAALCMGARADTAPVVFVEGDASDPVVQRLIYELRSSGFEVEPRALRGDPAQASLQGRGAIVHVPSAGGIEVWILDAVSTNAPAHPRRLEIIPVESPRAEHAGIAAARAAEILRARRLELEEAPPPAPAPTSPPPAPTRPPPTGVSSDEPVLPAHAPSKNRARGRLGFDLGPLALFSPGGVSTTLDLQLGVRWTPLSAWDLRGTFALPIVTAAVASSAGRASVAPWLAGLEVQRLLTPPLSAWSASVGVGVDVAWVRTRGTAIAPAVSSAADVACALPLLSARGTRTLWSPRARVAIGAALGSLFPDVGVRLGGQDVASWGRPLATGAVALEIDAL
jgi:hypothetical protein